MILYVTSFNNKLYQATGKELIKSFIKHNIESTLLVSYDDDIQDTIHDTNITYIQLDDYLKWKEQNKQYIPKYLGGTAPDCKCKRPTEAQHEPGCVHSLWNRRASQWASKTFTMWWAVNNINPYYIIWIDCDCVFINTLTISTIDHIFDKFCAVYHYGPTRKRVVGAIETGLFGFKKCGYWAINNAYTMYITQSYTNLPRWDDSYIYTTIMEPSPSCKDLISHIIQGTHVVQYGPFGKYIKHNKGYHFRNRLTP